MIRKLRTALATASVMAAVGTTALLGAGAAHAAGNNDNAAVYGRDVYVGWGNGTIGTCPLGDFCMYTKPGFTGKMFAFGHCEVYDLAHWNGYGSWVNYQTVPDDYVTDARVTDENGREIDRLSAEDSWWNGYYNWAPAWDVQPCGHY